MSSRTIGAVVCLTLLFFGVGSCSIMFMDTVPMQWSPSQKLKCSGYTLPVIDGSVAAGFVTITTIGVIDGIRDHESTVAGIAIGILVPVAVYVTSAVFGCVWASECHQAEKAQESWLKMGPVDQERFEDRWREERGVAPRENGS